MGSLLDLESSSIHFCGNLFSRFCLILAQTSKQTKTNAGENITSLAAVKISNLTLVLQNK